ncbi:N-terminal protein methyltransferase [Apiospora arundinis]
MGPAPTTRTTRGAAAAANEAAAAKTTAGGDETTTPAASEEQKTEGGGGEGENEAGAAPPPDSLIRTENGLQYWSGIDADVNGMLGGFPSISAVDLRGSRAFLVKLGIGKSQGLQKVERALEGGAGIGRITKGLLLDISQTVDVVEPIAKFTETLRETPGVGQIYNMGLEEWPPPPLLLPLNLLQPSPLLPPPPNNKILRPNLAPMVPRPPHRHATRLLPAPVSRHPVLFLLSIRRHRGQGEQYDDRRRPLRRPRQQRDADR